MEPANHRKLTANIGWNLIILSQHKHSWMDRVLHSQLVQSLMTCSIARSTDSSTHLRCFSSSVTTAPATLLCSLRATVSLMKSACVCVSVRKECVSVCAKERRESKWGSNTDSLSLSLTPSVLPPIILLYLFGVICFWNYSNSSSILLSCLLTCMCQLLR